MKNIQEILNEVSERIHYSRHAEQLQSLALTEFIKISENKGAIILSCSPKQIKLDNGEIKKVIGNWVKYTYNKESIYYIQFNSNPFFGVQGHVTQNNGASTGVIDITQVYDGVNEYLVSEENINQLIKNLITIEKYLASITPLRWDNSKRNFDKQEIYKI